MLITVFTPAYNRGHLLHRVYESLCKQTFRDFEWVVVDDGSVDETASLFTSNDNDNVNDNSSIRLYTFSSKNEVESGHTSDLRHQTSNFPIRYFYQENGGKHRAINRGVKEAQGELFFIVDSDDALVPNSLEMIKQKYEAIRDNHSFCGVAGMKGYFNRTKVGTQIEFSYLDCTILESSWKYHVYGDKAEAIRTKIMKEFPFPEYEGEKFCPEALIWNRISTRYKIRYFDEIIYLCEYLPDGLTSKISKLLEKNIKSTMKTYKEMNEYENVPLKFRIRAAINYYRYTLLHSFKYDTEFRLKLKWIWTLPLGIAARIIKG